MYNIVCACVQDTHPSYFSLQVKYKPYQNKEAMRLFLKMVQLRTKTKTIKITIHVRMIIYCNIIYIHT
jgi:hypothetical protein